MEKLVVSIKDVTDMLVTLYNHDSDYDVHLSFIKLSEMLGLEDIEHDVEGEISLTVSLSRCFMYLYRDKLPLMKHELIISFINRYFREIEFVSRVSMKELIYPELSLTQVYRLVLLDVQEMINKKNTENK